MDGVVWVEAVGEHHVPRPGPPDWNEQCDEPEIVRKPQMTVVRLAYKVGQLSNDYDID
jgi:hypothetical protein